MKLSYEQILIAAARKKMALKELRSKCGVTLFTMQRIKQGHEVRVKTAGKLAAVLGVDVTELMLKG